MRVSFARLFKSKEVGQGGVEFLTLPNKKVVRAGFANLFKREKWGKMRAKDF